MTIATARPTNQIDATAAVTAYLVALLFIPSPFSIAGIGPVAAPSQLIAMGCLVWWGMERLRQPTRFLPGRQPTTAFLFLFVGAVLASFVVAASRPITSDELRSSQQGLIGLFGWLGVYLITSDGITSRDRLDTLTRRLAQFTSVLCVLAVAQFITRQPLVDKIQIPGLSASHAIGLVNQRGGLLRPAATAIHPLEFGMALTMCLPFALHWALFGQSRSRFGRYFPALALCAVVPITVSRSTLLCSALVILILLPTWPRMARRVAYVVGLAGTLALYALSPGLINTLTSLFTGIADSSTVSRTNSYSLAFEFVSRWPVFGRGYLTFLPEYRILDNQYLGLLIDTGIIGLVLYLCTIAAALLVCLGARRRFTDAAGQHLAQATLASVAAGALGFAFFDAMSFPMAVGTFFVVLGLSGALRRISLTDNSVASTDGSLQRPEVVEPPD